MSSIEEKIIEMFEENPNAFYSVKELAKKLCMNSNEVNESFNNLLKKKIIFKVNETKFGYMSENHFVRPLLTTKSGLKYIELDGNERLYIDNENLKGAFNFDEVIVVKDGEIGKVLTIIKRANPNVVCEIENVNGIKKLKAFNIPGDVTFSISHNKIKNFVDGDRILVKVDNVNQGGSFDAEFVKYLGHKDDPNSDIKVIAASRDFEFEFSDEVLEEVKNIPTEVSEDEIKGRLDLRDKCIFTIDGKDTKDIDDAISLVRLPNGNFELGVHIANVSHYVKKGSAIYENAYERGTSVYLLNYVIPMLHHKLSNGICSLNPNEDRLARSCIMEIDKNGEVINYKICPTVINSKKKMNYDSVNSILENNIIPEGYEEFVDTLKDMQELSNILTNKRRKNGALDFASNEIKINVDGNGKTLGFTLCQQHSAEHLIENFMIIANETVASHITWLNLPCVYRVHDCPLDQVLDSTVTFISNLGYRINKVKDSENPKLIQQLLKKLSEYEEYPILSNLILRSMKRAYYTTENIGHFGLASNNYTHFTSPIRRFPDLIVHTLLDKYDNIYNESYDEEKLSQYLNGLETRLKESCKHSSYKERQADLAEDDSNKYAMLEYMEDFIGKPFEGTIIEITENWIKVKTDNQITGKVKLYDIDGDDFTFKREKCRLYGKNTGQQYRIGNKVLLTAKKVDKCDREIYFILNGNLTKDYVKVKKK